MSINQEISEVLLVKGMALISVSDIAYSLPEMIKVGQAVVVSMKGDCFSVEPIKEEDIECYQEISADRVLDPLESLIKKEMKRQSRVINEKEQSNLPEIELFQDRIQLRKFLQFSEKFYVSRIRLQMYGSRRILDIGEFVYEINKDSNLLVDLIENEKI